MSQSSNLEAIFFECLRRPSRAEQDSYLEEACANDPELLRRVRKMLESHGKRFLEEPACATHLEADAAPARERAGQRIGAYRLIEALGEGGMGSVWRAEQIEPVRRQVALKLIKAGLDSQPMIARFEAERQAQALMDHPHIARVLDGGTDDWGRPYLVMDLCVGVPITRYCDEQRLTLRRRLELFVHVCDAIQHAHQKGVIHRDIKPSNVLVAEQDGRAVPKVIDFGIAKSIERRLADHTVLTQVGFIGTLEYMSPEQAAQSPGGVDTRSDVYSLGALLYELLTGSTPLSRRRLTQASYADILRVITEEETPKPSTRIGEPGFDVAAIAAQRGVEPTRIASLLRGEIDWIVMRALDKDRDRRYATAAELAQDVQRFLADEPVSACPPSAGYRLRKFARRHRAALAASVAIVAASLIAIGGIGWAVRDREARTAEAARARSDRDARVATAVRDLLATVDRQLSAQVWSEALATVRRADAVATSGDADAATVRQVRTLLDELEFVDRLERIRSDYATWLADRLDSATAANAYAQAFHDHGVDVMSAPIETAIDRLRTTPALAMPLAAALDDWGRRYLQTKPDFTGWQRFADIADAIDPEPARSSIRAVTRKPAAEGAADLRRLADAMDLRAQHPVTIVNLAMGLQRFGQQAGAIRVLRDAQRVHPADFWLNFELGVALSAAREYELELRYDTAAVAVRPGSAAAHNNLGNGLRMRRDFEGAAACFRRALELDPKLATPRINLGLTLLDQGKAEESVAVLREATAVDATSSMAWSRLGGALLVLKRLDEAVEASRRAIALDPNDPWAHVGLSNVLRDQGKLAEAVVAARQAIAAEPSCEAGHVSLGNALAQQDNYRESIVAFRKALELKPDDFVAYANLGQALCGLNDPTEFDEALAACRRSVALNPSYALGHLILADTLMHRREYEVAIESYRRAIELSPMNASAHFGLGQAMAFLERTDDAIVAYRKSIELQPNQPQVHFKLALAHCGRGEFAEGESELQKTLALDPDNAPAHRHLAIALEKLGRHEEAIDAHRRATEIGAVGRVSGEQ